MGITAWKQPIKTKNTHHVFGLSSEIETYVCYAFKIQSTRGLDERCAYE